MTRRRGADRTPHRSVDPDTRPALSATRFQAVVGTGLAALAAGVGMLLLRSSLEVRSLPERLMEWLLLFVSPTLFEAALQRFGFDAKRYALDASIAVVLVLLAAVGYVGLRRGWRMRALASIGIGFWLFTMLVVMPLTSAGLFATALPNSAWVTAILGYLAVGLSHAAVLSGCRLMVLARTSRMSALPVMSRRAALGLAGGGLIAYGGTYLAWLLVRGWPSTASPITPDQPGLALTDGIVPPHPHPQAGVVRSPAPVPPARPTVQSQPTPATGPRDDPAEPATARGLARDTDGAVLTAGRQKGTLAPALTSTADFYVVTKNAVDDPLIHARDWHLLVDGEVRQPFQVDYTLLRNMPAVEVTATLECISNFIGKPQLAPFGAELISTAVWKGVPVRDILALAGGPKPGAAWIAVASADEFTTSLPLAAVMAPDTLLVYEMNGEVLPREHGYPVRLLVPGRYGLKNPKWVVGLRPLQREFLDWYGQRKWSRDAVVKTMSRIDLPIDGVSLSAGVRQVAGIAYAGSRSIARVEYSTDAGATWRTAELLEAPSPDRWVRWQAEFDLQPGTSITLVARATDGFGNLQVEAFSLPQPDGGTGWQSLDVNAV